MIKNFVFDFDSTIISVEGLDELAKIVSDNDEDLIQRIENLTQQGMEGKLDFTQSLEKRLNIIQAKENDIELLIEILMKKISKSFIRNQKFIESNASQIYVISGGFKEYVEPICMSLGIKKENIYANNFVSENGFLINFDRENPLSKNNGKSEIIKGLDLKNVVMIGDGYTDFEVKKNGFADTFIAFTENIIREDVVDNSDFSTESLDEILYFYNLERKYFFPRNKINVLLLENIHTVAVDIFKEEGYNIEFIKSALNEDELIEKIKDIHILGIRSKTNVTKKILDNAPKLLAIGAFCIGTNQIDIKSSTEKGISIFNAPYSNTRSVVELALGEMIMLLRNVIDKNKQLHLGKWDKSANNSFEIRGKKLGIVGYGHIGSQLSVLAESMGMKVYFYDVADRMPLGNAISCKTLGHLLEKSDIVSVHVDGRKENENLFDKSKFDQMKIGSYFINLSRGHVVNINDLKVALETKKILGASLDVYPYEPKSNDEDFVFEMQNLPNTILTPHIGGSTEEAQMMIANYVPEKLLHFVNNGSTYGSVNLPEVQLPTLEKSHRLLHIHKNTPGMLANINHIIANNKVNINGQYLKTKDEIGYVIIDIEGEYSEEFILQIKNLENTIKCRMLY